MRNPAPNIWAQSVLALSQEKWNTITHHGRGTSRSTVCLIQLLFFAWYWQLWLCFWILNFCMPWRLAIAMPKELWQVSCCRCPVLRMLWQLLCWITFTISWQHFWLSRVSEAPKRNKKKLRLVIRIWWWSHNHTLCKSQGLLCECNNYDLLGRKEIVISLLAFQETGLVHGNSTPSNVFFNCICAWFNCVELTDKNTP